MYVCVCMSVYIYREREREGTNLKSGKNLQSKIRKIALPLGEVAIVNEFCYQYMPNT